MKTTLSLSKIILIIAILLISITSNAQAPIKIKPIRKKMDTDTNILYKLTISEKKKFEKDSTSYQVVVYYTSKEKPFSAKEVYIEFPTFKYIYYKKDDSVYLFNKMTKKRYQSNIKTDSNLFYFNDILLSIELGPIFATELYLSAPFSSKAERFNPNIADCIGLTYTQSATGKLSIANYSNDFSTFFDKIVSVNTIIDTVRNCFKSMYLSVDSSKVTGYNTYSMNYVFDSFRSTLDFKNNVNTIINDYKATYLLSELNSEFDFEYLMKENNPNQKKEKREAVNLADSNQRYDIQLLTTDNKPIKLSDYKGKYLLLDFWFTNCWPCMKGIPKMDSLYHRYLKYNFILVGVNSIDEKMEAITDVKIKRNMEYLICRAPKGYDKFFKVPYFPTYILISPDQKEYKHIVIHSEQEYTDLIKELDQKLKYK